MFACTCKWYESNYVCHCYQVKQIYKGYGSIRKKPEIHAVPLKMRPTTVENGIDIVMDSMPAEGSKVMVDGVEVDWWNSPDVHWYIIGGQHTVTACRELAEELPIGSEARKDLLEFEVIPVYSRDTKELIRVSNALNLNIAERVAKENFRSCAELGRAAWIRAGRPEPHKGNGKSSAEFLVRTSPALVDFIYLVSYMSAASRYMLIRDGASGVGWRPILVRPFRCVVC